MTILFLHIPKTAGSSLRAMLTSAYPKERVLNAKRSPLPYQYSKAMFANKDVITGHFDWSIMDYMPDNTQVITMLRNPVDHLYSQIRYFVAHPDRKSDVSQAYQRKGLGWFLESPHVQPFVNKQTRVLAGAPLGEPVTAEHLPIALDHMEQCTVGLFEHFCESIHYFNHALHINFGAYEYRNNNDYDYPSLTALQILKMIDLQNYDYALYKKAQYHFERMLV